MSDEYLVFLPLEPVGLHRYFSKAEEVPFHCTLMRWFRLGSEYSLEELCSDLRSLAREVIGPVTLVSDKLEMFGPKNETPVYVLKQNDQLQELHLRFLEILRKNDSLPQEMQWVGEGYRPHVTNTALEEFLPGFQEAVTQLVLFERDEFGWKHVAAIESFSEKPSE